MPHGFLCHGHFLSSRFNNMSDVNESESWAWDGCCIAHSSVAVLWHQFFMFFYYSGCIQKGSNLKTVSPAFNIMGQHILWPLLGSVPGKWCKKITPQGQSDDPSTLWLMNTGVNHIGL